MRGTSTLAARNVDSERYALDAVLQVVENQPHDEEVTLASDGDGDESSVGSPVSVRGLLLYLKNKQNRNGSPPRV